MVANKAKITLDDRPLNAAISVENNLPLPNSVESTEPI